jgi:hypothetical protein
MSGYMDPESWIDVLEQTKLLQLWVSMKIDVKPKFNLTLLCLWKNSRIVRQLSQGVGHF